MHAESRILSQLAVQTLGPSLKYHVIPRIAADTGFSKATIRTYLHSRPPSTPFKNKVRGLYGWELNQEQHEAKPLPASMLQEAEALAHLSREVEQALANKDGPRAKCLHSRLTARLYEAFLASGVLAECTIHADLSAVFTLGRDTTFDGVLQLTEAKKLVMTVVRTEPDSRSLRKFSFKISHPGKVAELLHQVWSPIICQKKTSERP